MRQQRLSALSVALSLVVAASAPAQLVFQPPLALPAVAPTSPVSLGDVNGDGLHDAAHVEGHTVRRVRVSLAQGDGSFAPGYSVLVGTAVPRVDLVDVNGDGILDLTYPDDGGVNFGFAVRLGTGDGDFGAPITSSEPGPGTTLVAFGHIDGDDALDMLAVNLGTLPAPSFPPDIDILLGTGSGSFTLAGSKPLPSAAVAKPRGLAVGDVNADGHLDFAVVFLSGAVWVYRGFGDGHFTAGAQHVVGTSGAGLRLADVDSDGHLDLLVADTAADAVAVRFGFGDGSFPSGIAVPFGDAPSGLAVGDLDGDGALDLVVSQAGLGDVGMRRGLGDGNFGPLVTVSGTLLPASPMLGTLDGDARADIVLVTTGNFSGVAGALLSIPNHTYAPTAPFLDLGFALPGAGGYPILLAEGSLIADEPYAFTIANGPAGDAAQLVVGAGTLFAPFKGGIYVPYPHLELVGLPLDAAGALTLSGSWPTLPSGAHLFLQVWMQDLGGPQGWSSTSGLRLALP